MNFKYYLTMTVICYKVIYTVFLLIEILYTSFLIIFLASSQSMFSFILLKSDID